MHCASINVPFYIKTGSENGSTRCSSLRLLVLWTREVSSCACYLIQDQWQLHMIFVCIPAGLPGCSWTRVSASDPPAGAWPRGYRCRPCCGCTVRCVLPALTLFEISQVSLKQYRHRNKIIVVLRNYTSGSEISESRVKQMILDVNIAMETTKDHSNQLQK